MPRRRSRAACPERGPCGGGGASAAPPSSPDGTRDDQTRDSPSPLGRKETGMERHDLDIPEGTVWPATEDPDTATRTGGTGNVPLGGDEPVTLDEERDDVDR